MESAAIIAKYYHGVKRWSANILNEVTLNKNKEIEVSGRIPVQTLITSMARILWRAAE